MTVPSVSYVRYAPEQVKVDSVTIGVSTTFQQNPGFSSSQYLAVGEFQRTNGERAFNLCVDHEGVAIRTGMPQRGNGSNEYALYVDGDVFVTGRVIASNMLQKGGSNAFVILGDGNQVGNDSFWSLAGSSRGLADTLYYPGKVTLGNVFQAEQNEYAFHVSRSADHTIDHAQLAIHNERGAQLRIGMIGNSRASPAVVNTPPGTQLEFHMGRDQSYFEQRYLAYEWNVFRDPNNSFLPSNILSTTIADIPNYKDPYDRDVGRAVAPHMLIDPQGNVGIRTSTVPPLSYQLRQRDPAKPQEIRYFPMNESMSLHVNGPFYGSNVLMWDHESGSPKHLDELYVRRKGVTIPANQIEPGAFADGNYTFVSNISIMGPVENDYELTVHGDAHVTNSLRIDGVTTTNELVATDAMVLDIANFYNDVYFKSDVIVNEAIRLRGQIFVETLSEVVTDSNGIARSNYSWKAIDFAPTNPSYTNLRPIGQGVCTAGRFGVGIGNNDEVNHQMTIVKRDPGSLQFKNMFQIHLEEKSSANYRKSAWIGHPEAAPEMPFEADGSLVIATPSATDFSYSGTLRTGLPQNIYLYPGANLKRNAPFLIHPDTPPTLGVFHTQRVGILTFEPRRELDVRGGITFTDGLYYFDTATNQENKLGLWKARSYNNTNPGNGRPIYYRGIQYYDEQAPCVGIMGEADPLYSLRVGGAVKTDGLYNSDDRKLADWFDGRDAATMMNHVAVPTQPYHLYTFGNVGVGVKAPLATMVLKDNYQSASGTRLQLITGETDRKRTTSVAFTGHNSTGTYLLQHDDIQRTWELGYDFHLLSNETPRALWTRFNSAQNNYQVVIGSNLNALASTFANPNPDVHSTLTVGGNMSVIGDVNITGKFMVRSRTVASNADIQNDIPASMGADDVFLGGNHIVLMPATDKTVCIGNPINGLSGNDRDSLLRVTQNDSTKSRIATFRGRAVKSYIEIAGTGTKKMLIGVDNSTGTQSPFRFLDENENPFLSFLNPGIGPTDQRYVAFGSVNIPSAIMHVGTSRTGDDMFLLTKNFSDGEPATTASPSVQMEKKFQGIDIPTKWRIKGPFPANAGGSSPVEKLAFLYSDRNTSENEVFSFTSTGCIGLNNPNPTYALDIVNTGKRGSLRLLNTDNASAAPQLIFQSGASEFGADMSFDYRMSTSNDWFYFDMENVEKHIPLLQITNNGDIGIRGPPPSCNIFQVEVTGAVNIKGGSLYLNGNSVLDGVSVSGGALFNAPNTFFRPNSEFGGGVAINITEPTGNLFHIYSSFNCNLLVLDSYYDESQTHFRVQEGGPTGIYNMWRMAASNTSFYWSYFPNCGNEYTIDAGKANHLQALILKPASDASRQGEFDMALNGRMQLFGSEPSMRLGNMGQVAGVGNHVFIGTSSNVGIGTSSPSGFFHVFHANANTRPLVCLEQAAGSADLIQIQHQTNRVVTVGANGNVGIGTTAGRARLEIASGQIIVPDGTAALPSYSFTDYPSTGIFASDVNQLSVSTGGTTRMNFHSNGDVLIGTNISQGLTTISGNTISSKPVFSLRQQGTGDILNVTSSPAVGTSSTCFVIQANGRVGIGTSVASVPLYVRGEMRIDGSITPETTETHDLGSDTRRWRDLYMKGNTIYLGETQITRDTDTGHVKLQNSADTSLRNIIVDAVQIQNSAGDKIIIKGDGNNQIEFTTVSGAGVTNTYSPLLANVTQQTIKFGDTTRESTLGLETSTRTPFTIELNNTQSNHVEFYTQGVPRTIINNMGNIGIGTTIASSRISLQSEGGTIATFLPSPSSTLAPSVVDRFGNVGIHTTSPASALHVVGSNIFDGRSHFTSNVFMSTNLEVWGNSLTHGNSVTDSDIRLKKDLRRIEGALDKVSRISGYTFTKIRDGTRSTGLVAQEVEDVLPEAVSYEGVYLGLSYGNMIGLLVEAIKDLREEVQELKNKIK